MANRVRNLTGERFGRLVVQRLDHMNQGAIWLCRCDCGKEVTVRRCHLVRGATRSCGCLGSELSRQRAKSHGLSKTSEWMAWASMRSRCNSTTNPVYPRYGGRGITVCDRWNESFENFLADMGPKPGPKFTLERRDNERGYNPENCYWATYTSQIRNRRNTLRFTYRGQNKTLMEWAEELSMPCELLRDRLRRGFTFERAVSQKKHH